MTSNPSFLILTFGCKINQFESNEFHAGLVRSGFRAETAERLADIVIINSCAVTNRTERKILKKLRQIRKENGACYIVLAGCYGEVYPEDITKTGLVDHVTGNLMRSDLIVHLKTRFPGAEPSVAHIGNTGHAVRRTRFFLKVTDGCDSQCTYCVIWKARGRIVSELPEKVLDSALRAVDEGFREIVLLGTQLAGYGKDIGSSLKKLLDTLHAGLSDSGVKVRLSSLEPLDMEIFDPVMEFIRKGFVCRHLHIPVQSLSDRTLERMGRRYQVADIFRLFSSLADLPGLCVGIDLIAGFPGETGEEFSEVLDALDALKPLAYIHAFPFSPKKDTPAAVLPGQVDQKAKKERILQITQRSDQYRRAFYKGFIGTVVDAVIEEENKNGVFEATSDNFLKILVHGADAASINAVRKIEIVDQIGYNTSMRLIGNLMPLPESP